MIMLLTLMKAMMMMLLVLMMIWIQVYDNNMENITNQVNSCSRNISSFCCNSQYYSILWITFHGINFLRELVVANNLLSKQNINPITTYGKSAQYTLVFYLLQWRLIQSYQCINNLDFVMRNKYLTSYKGIFVIGLV